MQVNQAMLEHGKLVPCSHVGTSSCVPPTNSALTRLSSCAWLAQPVASQWSFKVPMAFSASIRTKLGIDIFSSSQPAVDLSQITPITEPPAI
eukprot:4069533-Amphidinium_carterae.2